MGSVSLMRGRCHDTRRRGSVVADGGDEIAGAWAIIVVAAPAGGGPQDTCTAPPNQSSSYCNTGGQRTTHQLQGTSCQVGLLVPTGRGAAGHPATHLAHPSIHHPILLLSLLPAHTGLHVAVCSNSRRAARGPAAPARSTWPPSWGTAPWPCVVAVAEGAPGWPSRRWPWRCCWARTPWNVRACTTPSATCCTGSRTPAPATRQSSGEARAWGGPLRPGSTAVASHRTRLRRARLRWGVAVSMRGGGQGATTEAPSSSSHKAAPGCRTPARVLALCTPPGQPCGASLPCNLRPEVLLCCRAAAACTVAVHVLCTVC